MELTARFLREAMGLTASEVAALTSHAKDDVYDIEDSGGRDSRYDEYVSDLIELQKALDDILEKAVEAVETDPSLVGAAEPGETEAAVFLVYDEDADFTAAHGEGGLFNGSSFLHRLIVGKIALLLELDEVTTAVIGFDADAFASWLGDREDSLAARIEWAVVSAER